MKAFFEAVIKTSELQSGQSRWHTKQGVSYQTASDDSFMRIKQRNAYPNTFLIQDGQTFLTGYADAASLELIKKMGARLRHEDLLSDLDREFLVVACDTKGSVRVMRDVLSTMPLFVYADSQQLIMSNEYTTLMNHLPRVTVSPTTLLRDLLMLPSSRQKIIRGTFSLGQTEELRYGAGTLEINEAPLCDFAYVPPAYDDQAPRMFKDVLEERLDTFWQTKLQGQKVGFELSGGFDSALVTGYYALRGLRDIQTFTIGFYGHDDSQNQKIQSFIKTFGCANQTVPARLPDHVPLSTFCASRDYIDSYVGRDIFRELFEEFVAKMAERGVEVAVTGVGGDEMCSIYKPETVPLHGRSPKAYEARLAMPGAMSAAARHHYGSRLMNQWERRPPYIPQSVASTFMAFFNAYIRHGIWPVTPFASPKLLYFMRHIEPKYLYERRIVKAYLMARGFPAEIYDRSTNESHILLLNRCIRTELDDVWAACMKKSVLIKKGFVQQEAAERIWQQRLAGTELYGTWALKYMELEKFLQQPGIKLDPVYKT